MKSIYSLIFLASLSTSIARAHPGWACEGLTEQDASDLSKLNLPRNLYIPEFDILYISAKHCTPHYRTCRFDGHTLTVQKKTSILKTKDNEKIYLSCRKQDEVGPVGGVGGSN